VVTGKKPDCSDFALELCSVDPRGIQVGKEWNMWADYLVTRFLYQRFRETPYEPQEVLNDSPARFGPFRKQAASIFTSFPVLLTRSCLTLKRNRKIVIARLVTTVGYGLLTALFYSPLGFGFTEIQTWLGLIQQLSPIVFIGMLVSQSKCPSNKDYRCLVSV
jgi:hypothetical protein